MCSAELHATKPYEVLARVVPAEIAALLALSYAELRGRAGPSVVVVERCRIRIVSGLFPKSALTGNESTSAALIYRAQIRPRVDRHFGTTQVNSFPQG